MQLVCRFFFTYYMQNLTKFGYLYDKGIYFLSGDGEEHAFKKEIKHSAGFGTNSLVTHCLHLDLQFIIA